MSRLQTKCMLGSAVFHALLLVMLVVGSAFVSPKPKEVQVPLFNMFNVQVTDFETQGGGGGVPQPVPEIKPTPAPTPQPVAPAPTPAPIVQQPEPIKTEPIKQPEPVKVEPKPEPKKIDPPKPKDTPRPKPIVKIPDKKIEKIPENKNQDAVKIPEPPKKHEVKVDLTKKIIPDIRAEEQKAKLRQEREEARKRAEAEARAQARAEEIRQARAFQQAVTDAHAKAQADAQQRGAALDRIANTLSTQGAGASPITIPGPGSQAFVNYSQLVWSMYYQAWETPQDRGRNPNVAVEIVIARDGRVVSAKISNKSGDVSLDKSVQQALDRVRRLPAFPVGATDETRTFNLIFNLKSKRELG
jgi:TolA protein